MSEKLKNIYLKQYHEKNHAKFLPFANYLMPINYDLGIIKEHMQVRNSVGLFDVSHMGQILIAINEKNIINLKKYIPLEIEKLKINKSYYSFLLNENGGIIDDLILSRIFYKKKEYFYIVYNSSRKEDDEKIFNNILLDFKILNNNSLLALQGPLASKLIMKLNILNKKLYFMNTTELLFLNEEIIVSRSGYTGEDGFEFSIPNKVVLEFINLIMNNHEIKLCGLGSRDTLRIEAGLCLYGNELSENITPIEASLVWCLHKNRILDKNLNGQKILLDQLNNGYDKIRIGLQTETKSIIRSNMKIFNSFDKEIGVITSGSFSPSLNLSIAMGYVDFSSKDDENVYSFIRGKKEKLNVVKLPFIKNNYVRG